MPPYSPNKCERCKKGFKVGDEVIEFSLERICEISKRSSSADILHDVYYHPKCFAKEHWKTKIVWLLLGLGRKRRG